MIGYELWDTRSGNLVEAFDAEAEALAAVARTAAKYGHVAIEGLALARVDDESDDVERVAAGAELLARARRAESNGRDAQGQQSVAGLRPRSGG